MIKKSQNNIDNESKNCEQCGHLFDPHIVIAYDTSDFSKGGEIRCPVPNCTCFTTIDFNIKNE